KPSFLVSLRTQHGDSIEPVDSLQRLFNLARSCFSHTVTALNASVHEQFDVFPNPALHTIVVEGTFRNGVEAKIMDMKGRVVHREIVSIPARICLPEVLDGVYVMILSDEGRVIFRKKVIYSPE